MRKVHTRVLSIAAALLLPVGLTAFVVQHPAIIAGVELFKQVMDITASAYVKHLPVDSLYVRAARGMIRELNDPFSELFSPKEAALFNQAMNGSYAGIGIAVALMPGGLVVQHLTPSSPAAKCGLREGDLIVQIDTVDVRSGDSTRVLGRIKGPKGTSVTLHVLRPGTTQPIPISVTRAVVPISAVPYTLMLEHHVGYVPLSIFNETAGADVSAAVKRLVDAGATRLVLDLRNNGGGETDQAVAISSLFLHQGQSIVTLRSAAAGDETTTVTSDPAYPTIPLVVLVNGYTASSSEIVAGALQDHDRARIIGTTTFGKGIGQHLHSLSDGYMLKLTEFEWLTPIGRSIQKDRTTLDPYADPDSIESDSAIHARPTFKSDAGRLLYGGGGIVPDLIVRDAFPSDRGLMVALLHSGSLTSAVLARYAAEVQGKVTRHFVVTSTMRTEVVRHLRREGLKIDDATLIHGRRYLDYLIGSQLTTHLFGDSTAKQKYLAADPQLRAALMALEHIPDSQGSIDTLSKNSP